MALDALRCDHLAPLGFKGLSVVCWLFFLEEHCLFVDRRRWWRSPQMKRHIAKTSSECITRRRKRCVSSATWRHQQWRHLLRRPSTTIGSKLLRVIHIWCSVLTTTGLYGTHTHTIHVWWCKNWRIDWLQSVPRY